MDRFVEEAMFKQHPLSLFFELFTVLTILISIIGRKWPFLVQHLAQRNSEKNPNEIDWMILIRVGFLILVLIFLSVIHSNSN